MKVRILETYDSILLETKIQSIIEDWIKDGISSIETNFSTCTVGSSVKYDCLLIGM